MAFTTIHWVKTALPVEPILHITVGGPARQHWLVYNNVETGSFIYTLVIIYELFRRIKLEKTLIHIGDSAGYFTSLIINLAQSNKNL